MAGSIRKAVIGLIASGDSEGYVIVDDATGFYKGQLGCIQRPGTEGREVQVTEVIAADDKLGLRYVLGPGEGSNYGRDDWTDYTVDTGTLYFGGLVNPFIGTTIAGDNSGATADIDNVVVNDDGISGYLEISNITGAFQHNERLIDDGATAASIDLFALDPLVWTSAGGSTITVNDTGAGTNCAFEVVVTADVDLIGDVEYTPGVLLRVYVASGDLAADVEAALLGSAYAADFVFGANIGVGAGAILVDKVGELAGGTDPGEALTDTQLSINCPKQFIFNPNK